MISSTLFRSVRICLAILPLAVGVPRAEDPSGMDILKAVERNESMSQDVQAKVSLTQNRTGQGNQ